MKFIEAMRTAVENRTAMRRPEMVGYVKAEKDARTFSSGIYIVGSTFAGQVGNVDGTYSFTYVRSVTSGQTTTRYFDFNGTEVSIGTFGVTITPFGPACKYFLPGDVLTVVLTSSTVGSSITYSTTHSVSESDSVFRDKVSFVDWNLEDSESGISASSFVVQRDTEWKSVEVTDVQVTSSLSPAPASLPVSASMMTMMLADDWFETTVEESAQAKSGTGLW